MDSPWLADLRHAWRGLRNRPGFTIAVVATLALGIGANAAMFGIVDRLLFRPPPMMREPETAHRVYAFATLRGTERQNGGRTYARFRDIREFTSSFSLVAGHAVRDLAIGVGDAAREMRVGAVSADFFRFFDAPPALGRYFTDAEDQVPAGTPVAVLSHALWQARYGGATDLLGTTLQVGPTLYTIIGIAPEGFVGLWGDRPPAVYVPITSYAAGTGFRSPRGANWWETYDWGWMGTIVRRKPGVSLAAANADLTNAQQRGYERQRAEDPAYPPTASARPRAMAGSILAERGPNTTLVARVATWLGGVSVIVLLIALANVANLMLARAIGRRREVALRLALGVSRARLVRQLLTESLVLGACGGGVGLLLAHWGGSALRTHLLEASEAPGGVRDGRTVLFAVGIAIVVGLLTGIAPIVQSARADLTGDLKSGVREGSYRASGSRSALLILQGALSVVLLVGALLFVRSLRNVRGLRLGYDVAPVAVVDLRLRGVPDDSGQRAALLDRLLLAARSMPEVEQASRQLSVPLWSTMSVGLFVDGIDTVSRLGQFDVNAVSPGYFATLGTRIVRGRGIEATDGVGAPRVAVISAGMGQVLWPGREALGQCLRIGADTMPCTTVVGIAEDVKAQSLAPDNTFYYYLPSAQFNPHQGGLFVRVRGEAAGHVEALRRRLQREMPGTSYVVVTPFSQVIGSQQRSWALGATMFSVFGGLALLMAAIGLYSVIAYDVAQRAHELGVRRALGAQASHTVRLVVMGALRLAGAGVALGGLAAWWAGRFVRPMLFSVSPGDPLVFATVTGILLGVALLASWYPALAASRVDPSTALRSE